jgi:hypothetical protein
VHSLVLHPDRFPEFRPNHTLTPVPAAEHHSFRSQAMMWESREPMTVLGDLIPANSSLQLVDADSIRIKEPACRDVCVIILIILSTTAESHSAFGGGRCMPQMSWRLNPIHQAVSRAFILRSSSGKILRRVRTICGNVLLTFRWRSVCAPSP